MKLDKQFLCEEFSPSVRPEEVDVSLNRSFDLAELFKVLGDETRVKIIQLLGRAEYCGCDLANILELSPPAISHHLRLLRSMKLVVTRRDGKMVFYRLRDDHILNIVKEASAFLNE